MPHSKAKITIEVAVAVEGQRSVIGTIPLEFTLDSPKTTRLTPRQEQVLDLLLAGKSNKEIASELFVSERTAKFHVSALLSLYGASSRIELVARWKK
jgi:DNA-binding NarL/FixJ family response regulator